MYGFTSGVPGPLRFVTFTSRAPGPAPPSAERLPCGFCYLLSAVWVLPCGFYYLLSVVWVLPSGFYYLLSAVWVLLSAICCVGSAVWVLLSGLCCLVLLTGSVIASCRLLMYLYLRLESLI